MIFGEPETARFLAVIQRLKKLRLVKVQRTRLAKQRARAVLRKMRKCSRPPQRAARKDATPHARGSLRLQRYPPALGGSEAYFARLSRSLVDIGDAVTVHTSTAVNLEAFWSIRSPCLPASDLVVDGVHMHASRCGACPGRRFLLKPLSFIPNRLWQCLTIPCNPISFGMWAEAGRARRAPVDVVHATAFPYAWPIACGLRLSRRLRVPFFVTPFLHLGDPEDPADRVRRAYTSPAACSGSCTPLTASSSNRWGACRPARTRAARGENRAARTGGQPGRVHERRSPCRPRTLASGRRRRHRPSRQSERGEGEHRPAGSGAGLVAAGPAFPCLCWRGRRCRTSAASGQASRRPGRSSVWVCWTTLRSGTSSRASTCSRYRVARIRSASSSWRHGPTASRTWPTQRGRHRRPHPRQ